LEHGPYQILEGEHGGTNDLVCLAVALGTREHHAKGFNDVLDIDRLETRTSASDHGQDRRMLRHAGEPGEEVIARADHEPWPDDRRVRKSLPDNTLARGLRTGIWQMESGRLRRAPTCGSGGGLPRSVPLSPRSERLDVNGFEVRSPVLDHDADEIDYRLRTFDRGPNLRRIKDVCPNGLDRTETTGRIPLLLAERVP
jgi:hypothetical protein